MAAREGLSEFSPFSHLQTLFPVDKHLYPRDPPALNMFRKLRQSLVSVGCKFEPTFTFRAESIPSTYKDILGCDGSTLPEPFSEEAESAMRTYVERMSGSSISEGGEGAERDEAKSEAFISYLTEYIPEREAVRPEEQREVGLPAPGAKYTARFGLELAARLDTSFDKTAPGALEQGETLYLRHYVKKAEEWIQRGEPPVAAGERTSRSADTAL
jgi:hypothetical protein